jgi:hypothetical protein
LNGNNYLSPIKDREILNGSKQSVSHDGLYSKPLASYDFHADFEI